MKKTTIYFGAAFFILLTLSLRANSQTNVSGNINNNVTWTKANSPYIVIGSVVVMPGAMLTIEAGVVVKFYENTRLTITQGTLIASGNSIDSITFTSNSSNPNGIMWDGILYNDPADLKLNYCNFKYADIALNTFSSISFPLSIKHCSFYYNYYCITENYNGIILEKSSFFYNDNCIGEASLTVSNCKIDSCIFINNSFGVHLDGANQISNSNFNNNGIGLILDNAGYHCVVKNCIFCNNDLGCGYYNNFQNGDTLINCNFFKNRLALDGACQNIIGNIFTENDTALHAFFNPTDIMADNFIYHNQLGILMDLYNAPILSNNRICNNTIYNLLYTGSSYNTNFQNTCWCDTDSAAIAAKIYDGSDYIALGLVTFIPFTNCDSSVIASIPPINCQTVIFTGAETHFINSGTLIFEVYPNPAHDKLTVSFNATATQSVLGRVIALCDLTGRIILERTFVAVVGENKMEIDVSGVARGVYVLKVNEERGMVVVE